MDNALVPIEQKQVIFYDDEITAVLVVEDDKREIYVSLRQLCDLLGVSYQGQIRRIHDDPVLSKQLKGVNITFTPSGSRGGGPQTTNCLPIDYLNGWLFSINANRVKTEVRDRLIIYQEKCYKVLAEAFREGHLTTDTSFDDLLQRASSDVVEAYQIAQAIMKLARNQIMMETRLDDHGRILEEYNRRLETIEADLHQEDRYISESQATQISQAVRAIGRAMMERTGQNEYGRIWGEFYRKFGVSKYRHLPISKFETAMKFLTEWHAQETGEEPF
jgi:hypothetical protein